VRQPKLALSLAAAILAAVTVNSAAAEDVDSAASAAPAAPSSDSASALASAARVTAVKKPVETHLLSRRAIVPAISERVASTNCSLSCQGYLIVGIGF